MPQPKENSPIKRDILFRVHLLYAAFVLIAALVFARLIWVQLFSSEVAYNAERLEGRIFTDEIIPARRGNILTRDGEPLATSLFRYQVEMDYGSPGFDSLRTFREQSDSLAKLLALYFRDKSAAAYAQAMQREHTRRYRVTYRKDTLVPRSEGGLARWWDRMRGEEFLTVKLYDTLRDHTPVALFPREIDYTEWQTLRRYPILNWNMGMTYRLRERDERVYPQGELARRTIGQVGDKGNYGVEYVLRDVLEGRDGKARRQRIARGFYGRVVGGDNSEPEDGLDVVTTLDLEMQDVADRALRRQLEAQNALWGTALVMEVATGDLLAMANLSRTKSGAYAEVKNHALSSRMEPGSTFKLAALLALVDDAGMSLDETFDTGNGARVKVGRTTVQDSHGLPPLNLKDAVAHSSNVFFARAVYETYKDDPERYVDYLRHLHLDRTVGLEEFGAVAPIFPAPGMKIWYPDVSIVNMGYGYAIELTPLHTLTLYNAVANDGCMVAPRLVREIRRGGEVVERPERRVLVDKICSSSALRKVRECLEEVGTTGTAKQFFRDTTLFKIAGKTGTTSSNYDRYFVGYTPYYTAAVWIGYDQNASIRANGNPAAQLWKKVMSEAHENLPNQNFNGSTADMTQVTVCTRTGLLQGPGCTDVQTVWVAASNAPALVCDGHVAVNLCTESGKLATEYCPAECVQSVNAIDFTTENLTAAWGYERTTILLPLSAAEYEAYAAQQAADPTFVIPAGKPVQANDSGSVFSDLMMLGPCTLHQYVEPEPTPGEGYYDENGNWVPAGETDPTDPTDPEGSEEVSPERGTDFLNWLLNTAA